MTPLVYIQKMPTTPDLFPPKYACIPQLGFRNPNSSEGICRKDYYKRRRQRQQRHRGTLNHRVAAGL